MHTSHLIITFPPDPRPFRATHQASYHSILRGLRIRGDDPNAPPLIFDGVLEEGAYSFARLLLRRQMIEKIIRKRPFPALFHPLFKAPVLPPLHGLDPTCPDCLSRDDTVAHLFSCPTHPTALAPVDMWVAPLQVAQLF